VPNPSFEIYDTCPTSSDQINYASGWYGFSSEYYNSCASGGSLSFGVPSNFLGHQVATSGNAYGGLYTHGGAKNYREHIGTPLHTPLIIGTRYFISFKVSLADNSDCATNNIGITFTKASFNKDQPPPILNYSALHSQSLISDKLNWSTIAGSFLADSAYEYIAVGNFFSDSLTNTSTSGCDAYYYLDDVCVSTDSLACDVMASNDEVTFVNNVYTYPNPANQQLYFKLPDNDVFSYTLINMSGEEIKSKNVEKVSPINVSEIPTGVYLLIIQYKGNLYKRKQLIIH